MKIYWKDLVAKVLVYTFIPLVISLSTILVSKIAKRRKE